MADQEVIHRRASGLQTNPNRYLVPEGSLLVARNATIDRQGVISQRRGFKYHASLNQPGSAIFEYLKMPLVLDGTILRYDPLGDGVLSDWPGSYVPPPGQRMRGSEIDRKFLFTTDQGPFIQESPDGTPRRAGIPQGLDVQLSFSGTGLGGSHLPDSQISYRVIFGTGTNPPGAPSFPEVIANLKNSITLTKATTTVTVNHTAHGYTNGDTIQISDLVDTTYINGPHVISNVSTNSYTYTVSVEPTTASTTGKDGKTFKVSLQIRIPPEVQTGWWCEIYRTLLSADALTWPGDTHYLVQRIVLTDSDISAGFFTFLDTRDDSFLADELYTNPGTREGMAGANNRPPYAEFIEMWRGHTWYMGNVRWEHQKDIQLLDVVGIQVGDSVTITSEGSSWTYTAGNAEDHGTKTFKIWTTEVLGSVNVRKTAKSLIHIINGNSTCPMNAHYPWDQVGLIRLIRKDLLDIPFYLTVNRGNFGILWNPSLPISGKTVISDPNKKPHIVSRSKFQKPESVPLTSTNEIGRLGQEILGPKALRESLIIFAWSGVNEITGETDGSAGRNFTVREVDQTLRLLNSDCLCSLDTDAFAWTDGGLCRVSSAGSSIVSVPIDVDFQTISRFDAFNKAFFVPYESYHKLIVWIPTKPSSPVADGAFVYDYILNLWMGPWDKSVTSAAVINDLLYICRTDVAKVSVERKTRLGGEDFVDEEDSAGIIDHGSTIINGETVSTRIVSWAGEDLRAGWLYTEGLSRSKITNAVNNGNGTWTITLEDFLS